MSMIREIHSGRFARRSLNLCMVTTLLVLLLGSLQNSSPLQAIEPDQGSKATLKSQNADELVSEALYGEIYGDVAKRESLLKRAIELDPDHAQARWQLGFVKTGSTWQQVDELIDENLSDRNLQKYHELKTQPLDTVEQHISAANWCRQHELPIQERAHLEATLELQPKHAQAHNRLGHRLVAGQWMTSEEVQEENQRAIADHENLKSWRARLLEIDRHLHSDKQMLRRKAELKLKSIKNATAVQPMELLLSGREEAISLLVVETISRIKHQEAADSLARHAVFSQWPQVREQAAVKLRGYDQFMYIPTMLSAMQTPVTGIRWTVTGNNGRLYYRQMLINENQTQQQLAVSDIEYRRLALGGSQLQARNRAIADMRSEATQTDMAIRMNNMQVVELNERVSEALTISTSQNMGDDPRDWWQWWDDENDVVVEQKEQVSITQTRSVEIVDPTQSAAVSSECLVAGTQILTGCGFRSVETISVGDTVLSKDPVTGQLAFKPVVKTTEREEGKLIRFTAGDRQITSSQGHPFWVSGSGWVKARDLSVGMSLHSADGVAIVRTVEDGGVQQTFNLVVADFHTYFVGSERLLSHDVTMREAVDVVVPGMQQ